MSLIGIFQRFIWVLIGLLMLVPITKFLWHSSFYKVKRPRILLIFIASPLLSVYFGYVTSSDRAFAFPFAAQPFSSTILLTYCNQMLRCLQEERVLIPWITVAVILLLFSIIFWRRLFGRFLTWTTIIIFLVLLIHTIIIFVQHFSLISEVADRMDTSFISYLNNLWQVLGLIILLGLLALVLHWLSSRRGGIVVLPFEVESQVLLSNPDQSESQNKERDKPNNQKHYYSKVIADWLIEELHRIRQIYASAQELEQESTDKINIRLGHRNFPPLSCIPSQFGDELAEVGTVELGKAQLSIGHLLLSLRRIWPFGGVEGIITGSIHSYGKSTRIVARIEYGKQMSAWEVTSTSVSIESIPEEMIRELAYKIAFEIVPNEKLPAGTWKAFQHITEAIGHLHQYLRIKKDEEQQNKKGELEEAANCLKEAKEQDCKLVKRSSKKSELLADLFYKIGIFYLLTGKNNDAEINIKMALDADSNWKSYHYYFNGLGNIYWKQGKLEEAEFEYKRCFLHIKQLNEERRACPFVLRNKTICRWLKENIKYFVNRWILYSLLRCLSNINLIREVPQKIKQKALIFPYSYNGLGNIYFERGEYEEAQKKYQFAIKEDKDFWKSYHNLGNIYLYSKTNLKKFCCCNSSEEQKMKIYGKLVKKYEDIRKDYLEKNKEVEILNNPAVIIRKIDRYKQFKNIFDDYNKAIKEFKQAVELSQHRSAFSHSGLGLAYLLMAIEVQLHLMKDKDSKNQKPQKNLILGVENLLEEALHEVQLAVDVDGEDAIFYWNLGLVKLWCRNSCLDEVHRIWQKAVNKASQEEPTNQEEHNLRCAIYRAAREAIVGDESALLNSNLQYIENILKKQDIQERVKKGKIKMMLKDLLIVQIALKRLCPEEYGNQEMAQVKTRPEKAYRNITRLKGELKTKLLRTKSLT